MDGVEVLYRTSTFHMPDYTAILIPHLSVLTASRLSRITSLEIAWVLSWTQQRPAWQNNLPAERTAPYSHTNPNFVELLAKRLPEDYPNLRRLVLSVKHELGARGELYWRDSKLEEELLTPIDALARSMALHSPDCQITFALPAEIFIGELQEFQLHRPIPNAKELWRAGQRVSYRAGLAPSPVFRPPASESGHPGELWRIVDESDYQDDKTPSVADTDDTVSSQEEAGAKTRYIATGPRVTTEPQRPLVPCEDEHGRISTVPVPGPGYWIVPSFNRDAKKEFKVSDG